MRFDLYPETATISDTDILLVWQTSTGTLKRISNATLRSQFGAANAVYGVVSSNFSPINGSKTIVNASCTLTLPATPAIGNVIEVFVPSGVTLTVNPNGKKANGVLYTTDYPTIPGFTHTSLVYLNETTGWTTDISGALLPPTISGKLLSRASWVQMLGSDGTFSLSGSNVISWANAGTGDAAIGSTGTQPTFVSSATPSGKPAVAFSGSQNLTHTALTGRERTIFILAKHTPALVYDGYFLGSNSSSIFFGYDTGGNSPRLLAGSGGYFSSSPYSSNQNQWRIYELVISSAGVSNLLVNGTQDSTNITINSDLTTNRISGYTSGRNFQGQIALIAQTNTALSSTLRTTIRQDIATWAGITL
ncbi:hypothetical protein [Nostoc sp. 2RC]|uniref:hypothetical protein n=1 Tax=Nostoc sp. 2RC TaxID=2485484 RepID=UPI00162677A1|nr:hypothetical protein [Nostoc sp. 2RC]MBC1242070.1 hypothetical protein [Nostoc sp. 2RC]